MVPREDHVDSGFLSRSHRPPQVRVIGVLGLQLHSTRTGRSTNGNSDTCLLILMGPAIRNRRAGRFRISVGHCGAYDIRRECRRWRIRRLEGALIPSMHSRLAEEVP